MKRIFKLSVSAIITANLLTLPVLAAYEEPSYFSTVSNNGNTTYYVPYFSNNGGHMWMDGNITLNALPYGMMDEGTIYTICCYNNKIYYSTGMVGGVLDVPAKIYCCDMNGQNNILLADNAQPYNEAIIVDNVLYYQEFRYASLDSESWDTKGYDGGITKINLNNLSWKRLVVGNVRLSYCDGDYVYYTNDKNLYAAIDTNGENVMAISPYANEFKYRFIKKDKVYYIQGSSLYEKVLNQQKQRRVSRVPYDSEILNVSSDSVYYADIEGVYTTPTVTVYKEPRT